MNFAANITLTPWMCNSWAAQTLVMFSEALWVKRSLDISTSRRGLAWACVSAHTTIHHHQITIMKQHQILLWRLSHLFDLQMLCPRGPGPPLLLLHWCLQHSQWACLCHRNRSLTKLTEWLKSPKTSIISVVDCLCWYTAGLYEPESEEETWYRLL